MIDSYIKQWSVGKKSFSVTKLLQCNISRVTYDFETKVANFYLPYSNCTDMTGAIYFAKQISSDVEQVQVFEDNTLINIYLRIADKWTAQSFNRPYHDRRISS
jgi:hypothetical protein